MKLKTLLLVVTTLVISVYSKECTPTSDEIVEVLETEVDSYDHFIYNRYLNSELETCHLVTSGMSRLRESFDQELEVALAGAQRQFQTIVEAAKSSDAGPCVHQTRNVLRRHLNEENSRFQKCLDVPAAQLGGIEFDLSEDIDKYSRLKARTKEAIKGCLINMPSACPNMTTTCMDTQLDTFNNISKSFTESRHNSSPCMGKFVEALQCFSRGVDSFVRKARLVEKRVAACFYFEDDLSIRQSMTAFATTLNINSTLLEQVKRAQWKFQNLNTNVVKTLGRYYNLEKSARMTYKFSSHDKEYFKKRLNEMFAGSLSTVERVRRSKRHVWPQNKADECCDKAVTYIHSIIDNAANSFEKCEEELLSDTLGHINDVRHELGIITEGLSEMGNSAILDCLSSGAILTENAIEGCYDLRHRKFLLDKQDGMEKVDELMIVLERYNRTYFNVSESITSLCGNSYLQRVVWLVDNVIFRLKRCPYERYFRDEIPTTTTEVWEDSSEETDHPFYTTEYYRITDEPEL